MAYRIARAIARLLVGLFHRRVLVLGLEHLPADGPLVVTANHHGALIDPLLLIAHLPRPLRPLAKAPLFSIPLLSGFLRAFGALPVYRPQDRHIVRGDNRQLFQACRQALAGGSALLIFPEGVSKAAPTLSSLRPGAARMALEAEAEAGFTLGVRIVPIGIHLEDASSFRRGSLTALVGPPLEVAGARAAWETGREAGVQILTGTIEAALRALVAEARSVDELRLLRRACRAWARERGQATDAAGELQLARRFAARLPEIEAREPRALAELRARLEDYSRTLDHFGLAGDEIDIRHSPGSVLRFLLTTGGSVLLGAPLGWLGAAIHWLPFRATGLLAGRFASSEDSWSSAKLTLALVAFPLWWLALGAVATWTFGPLAGLGTALAAPLLGLLAVRHLDRWEGFRRSVRAFVLLAGGGDLRRHLADSRRALADGIDRLAGLA